jgi:hypothetical protein
MHRGQHRQAGTDQRTEQTVQPRRKPGRPDEIVPNFYIRSAAATRLRKELEKLTDIANQQIGLFQGGEVAALFELAPVHDVFVVAVGEAPNGKEVVGEHRNAHRETGRLLLSPRSGVGVLIVELPSRSCGFGQPIEHDIRKNLVAGQGVDRVAAVGDEVEVPRQLANR